MWLHHWLYLHITVTTFLVILVISCAKTHERKLSATVFLFVYVHMSRCKWLSLCFRLQFSEVSHDVNNIQTQYTSLDRQI
jgi:hypothetical protein